MKQYIVHRFIKSIAISIFLFLFAIILFATNTKAHASPVSYTPKSGEHMESVSHVEIVFSERIEESTSSIVVTDKDGEVVSEEAFVDPENVRIFRAPLKIDSDGIYIVTWELVSKDDGHFSKGSYHFIVGDASNNTASLVDQIQVQHITSMPEISVIFLELLGFSFLVGFLVFEIVNPYSSKNTDLSFEKSKRRFVSSGFFLIVVGTIGFLILKTFDLQQLKTTSFFETFLLFLTTNAGLQALLRCCVAIVGLIAFKYAHIGKEYLFGFCVLVFAISRVLVSHAAASFYYPEISIIVNTIHYIAKSVWVGSIIFLAFFVLPHITKTKTDLFTKIHSIISLAFAFGGATGAYVIWLHLKSPENILTTEWGVQFVLLTTTAAVFLVTRCINFLFERKEKISFWYRTTIRLEAFLGIVIIFLTAFIMSTTPPFTPEKNTFKKENILGSDIVSLSSYEYQSDTFLVTIISDSIYDDVSIFLTNRQKDIVKLGVTPTYVSSNRYVLPLDVFTDDGEYLVEVLAKNARSERIFTSFSFSKKEYEESFVYPNERSLDLFTIGSIVGGFVIFSIGMLLFIYIKKYQKKGIKITINKTENVLLKHDVLVSMSLLTIYILSIFFVNKYFLTTSFKKSCERKEHFWIQSAPMRNGVVMSPNTYTGCTLKVGLYHFADEDAYNEFVVSRDITTQFEKPENVVYGEEIPLTFTVSDRDGKSVGDLTIEHERVMHIIIVDEDLENFSHIHPESFPLLNTKNEEGAYSVNYVFPHRGRYSILVDYVSRTQEISEQFFVDVVAEETDFKREIFRDSESYTKQFGEYEVTLELPKEMVSKEWLAFNYVIRKDGEPVNDLTSYLGATMHIATIRDNMGDFLHTHGEVYVPGSSLVDQIMKGYINYHSHFVPARFGPRITARLYYPNSGRYKIFGEFKHGEEIVVTDFWITIE